MDPYKKITRKFTKKFDSKVIHRKTRLTVRWYAYKYLQCVTKSGQNRVKSY